MKEMRRVLALVLCMVMLIGIIPAGAFAAEDDVTAEELAAAVSGEKAVAEETEEQTQSDEIQHLVSAPEAALTVEAAEDVDYLFIATDRHTNTSIIGTMISNMENSIGENELDYLALGGDMVGSGGSHPAYNSSTVLKEVTDATSSLSAANVDIVAGIHDMNVNDDAGIVLAYTSGGAQIYEGKKFYVYGVPESNISGAVSGVDPEEQANAFVTWANGDSIDKSKAIIVVSHYPLHVRRNDNDGAVYWAAALNQVATGGSTVEDPAIVRNVAFFWGHNHTQEAAADTAVYHVAPKGTISVEGGSSSQTIYFTYANAGYLNSHSSATLVTITDSKITFDKYKSSSVSTSYSVDRVVVEEEVTLTGIAVTTAPTTTEYTVGDTFSTDGMVVTATYSDGTTAAVTDYTLSEVDMTTAGTKTVTVTYQDKTATFDITVSEAATEPSEPAGPTTITFWDDYETVTIQATATGLTEGTAANVSGEIEALDAVYTDYVALDITLTGAAEGAEVAYSILVVENMDTTNMTVYHVDGDTLTPVACEVVTDAQGNQYVEFTSDLTGTFAYGSPVVPEGYAIDSISIEGIPYDVFVGTSVDLTDSTITATYTKDGAEDFIRVLTVYDYDLDNFSEFDVNTLGKQTIIFTFDGAEKTFDINVWGEEFTVDGVTVHVGKDEYGVTNAVVSPSTNTNVAAAVNGFLVDGTYVSYDISLTFAENYETNANPKTVTLPVPEGVTKPAVYYVPEAGAGVEMPSTVSEDGTTVTFTTEHFSTYTVGESKEIPVLDPKTATGEHEDTKTETKTVYVLSSGNPSGNVLIANSATAGSVNLVANDDGDLSNTSATVVYGDCDGDGDSEYYIELTDAQATNSVWAVAGSYTFENQEEYLRCRDGNLSVSSDKSTWSYDNNRLSYKGRNDTYYLRYNNGWTVTSSSGSASSIYFYVPTEVKVEVSTTISGTYSIFGSPAAITKVVPYGTNVTVELSSNLKFVDAATGDVTNTDNPENVKYEVVENGDPTGVVKEINGNTVTLSGTGYGTALIRVSYTTVLGDVDNYITITAERPVYDLTMYTKDGTEVHDTPDSMQIKRGAKLDLSETKITYADASGTVVTVSDAEISWTVTDAEGNATTLANIEDGVVTFGNTDGTVMITASWTEANTGTVYSDSVEVEIVEVVWTMNLEAPVLVYTEVTYSAENHVEGAAYYTKNEDGTYTKVETPVEGTTYYTVEYATEEVEDSEGNTYPVVSTNDITAPIVVKNVTAGQTYTNVWAVIKKDGVNIGTLSELQVTNLEFYSSNESIAKADKTTGDVTFEGVTGSVRITAVYDVLKTDESGRPLYTYDGKDVYAVYDEESKTIKYYYSDNDQEVVVADGFAPAPQILIQLIDSVVFSVSEDGYTRPEDGTSEDGISDFPEYPDEGAIRFDKTATAVGNFSETGVTKLELSMTGVPYSSGNEIDVVVMLDMTGSMSDKGMEAAEKATKAFVEKIVKNDDGTYNKNRVAVYAFNSGSSSPYELVALKTITSDAALTTANTAIETASDKQTSGGTPFDEAAEKCYDVLQAAKTTNLPDGVTKAEDYARKQFCVFMSDGGPTTYYGSDKKTYYGGNNNSGDVLLTSCMTGYASSTSSGWKFTLPTEYYTDAMKADNVTVYTVGLMLQTAPSNPAPYSSMTNSTYDSTTDSLTTIGSHYYFTSSILKQMASDESKYMDIFNVDNASKATATFEAIAMSIREAAKDVVVQDKITDEYTMIFEAPNTDVATADGDQEYYIEVTEYTLKEVKNANDETIDYVRDTATSKIKLYLGYKDSSYYAASDNAGTAYATPTFDQTALGTKFYWTTDSTKSDSDISVNGYYFTSKGDGTHNMASGAYASGTKDESGTSQNLIIATPYFVYNAATRMLAWTAEKLNSTELALTYFLYLEKSGGYVGKTGETEAGTYQTNEWATITYTNVNSKECQDEFPVPQMTWNGAQVSYVFYLVNEAGQPVNRAGRVVPFSEAVYVTDVYTHSVIWNSLERAAGLEAQRLAEGLVPDVYELYDMGAVYSIHVYEDENEVNLNNHFTIASSESVYTTYVFNTKSDAAKYTIPGTYVANDKDDISEETNLSYLCKSYNVTNASFRENDDGTFTVTDATYVEVEGETQWKPDEDDPCTGGTKIEGYVYYVDENNQVYTIVQKSDGKEVHSGFDFSNTTVAFAVVWKNALVEDTVVIDFGLDVVVDVVKNDGIASGVVGVRADAPAGVAMNSGAIPKPEKKESVSLTCNGVSVATASLEPMNLNVVRISLDKDNGMLLSAPLVFYYESEANYYQNNTLQTKTMYSKVTVIPATTVYYEDEYVTLKTHTREYTVTELTEETFQANKYYTKDETTGLYTKATAFVEGTTYYAAGGYVTANGWDVNSVAATQTQQVDRPGEDKVGGGYDADNIYGYDPAYGNSSTYSLGKAAKTQVVNGLNYATAEFEFYGTGFDVISLTSNKTGTITIAVKGTTAGTDDKIYSKNFMVDTYYGYYYDADQTEDINGDGVVDDQDKWVLDKENEENSLYQVPVMKVSGLTYDKYTVTITASHAAMFDHEQYDGKRYDFWLDAIRIYDPCGTDEIVDDKGDDDTSNDITVGDAYGADGEYDPDYYELRNQIIDAKTFGSFFEPVTVTAFEDGITYYTRNTDGSYTIAEKWEKDTAYYVMVHNVSVYGAMFVTSTFIDGKLNTTSISDYTNYGPNNEVYLAKGQIVAAEMNYPDAVSVHLGIKTVGGTGSVEVYGIKDGKKTYAVQQDISTATDMYFDITELNGSTLVIRNSAQEDAYQEIKDENGNVVSRVATKGAIVSITNLKVTHAPVKQAEVDEEPTADINGLTVNSTTPRTVLLSLRAPVEEEAPVDPDGNEPGGDAPEGNEPDGSEPDGSEPEGSEPEGSEPEGGEPDSSEPDESQPEASVPSEPAAPEETEPEEQETIEETVRDIIEIIRDIIGIIGGFFGGWF